jgi:outer membrane protein
MKKSMKCLITILCFVQVTQAQTGMKLTLKECVDIALKNNQQALQADLTAEAAQVNLKQAKNVLLPDLFATLGHGFNQGRSIDPFTNAYVNRSLLFGNYSVSSSVLLFNGLQSRNLVKQNNLLYEANKLDAQQTKENIMLNVILAYLQVLNNEDLLQQSRNQLEVTNEQVSRLEALNKAGAVAPQLLYDLRGQRANDELAIISNQNALNEAKLTLAQLMNIPYDINLQVERLSVDADQPSVLTPADDIYKTALKQLPMMQAATLRKESAEKAKAIARGGFYPTVSLIGALNTNYSNAANREVLVNTVEVPSNDFVMYNGNKLPVIVERNTFETQKITYVNQLSNNFNTAVFLNVSIPLLNGFRARNQVALANIEIRTAQVNLQAATNQLNQQVAQAHYQLSAASSRLRTLQQQVADFSESFRTAEVRFNAGVITQVEYLLAKNNADQARINLILARYDYLFRNKILSYYQGKLEL